MDSGLINLIPNLAARRSTKLPRDEFTDPPPPYTPTAHSNPNPQRNPNSNNAGIPLQINFLGANQPNSPPHERPLLWSRNDTLAIGSQTTYAEFLVLLRQKLDSVDGSRDLGPWQVGIEAEFRGRTVLQFGKQVVDVDTETWGQISQGLGESRFRGLRVSCWRKDSRFQWQLLKYPILGC